MRTSEALRAARDLIDTPEKWCQRACGRDITGRVIGPEEFNAGAASHAVSRCSVAALVSVEPGATATDAFRVLSRAVLGTVDQLGVVGWNNAPERTHAEVVAAFDTAISYAEAAEQEFSPSACAPVDSLAAMYSRTVDGQGIA